MSEESKYAARPGRIPGVLRNLGGVDFVVPPLNLDQVQEFEEKIKTLGQGDTLASKLDSSLPIVLAALQRNYPDITAADLRPLIDLGNFAELIDIIVSSSGFKRAAPGEAMPASR